MCPAKKTKAPVGLGSTLEMFRHYAMLDLLPQMPTESIDVVQSYTPSVARQSTPVNCVICKKLVKIIQRQLKDNATDKQIINVLTEVCEVFPAKDRDNCQQVVKDYADKLIETLTQDIDPNIACALAGLCVPSRFVNYLNGYYLQRKPVVKNIACEECEMIAHFIQNEMYNFKNEEQIESFIKNVMCTKLSYFIKEKDCDTFVNDYTPLIMQLIAQEVFDPTTLCFKEIKICTNNTQAHVRARKFSNCQLCQKLVDRVTSLPATGEVMPADKIARKVCKSMPTSARVEVSLTRGLFTFAPFANVCFVHLQCDSLMKTFGSYFVQASDREETAYDICRVSTAFC